MNARLIRTGLRAVAVLSLILTGLRLEPAAAADHVIDLDIGGGSQRLLFAGPPQPRAAIVMLPGGSGDIGLEKDGRIRHGHNFVVRTRDLWTALGFAVLRRYP